MVLCVRTLLARGNRAGIMDRVVLTTTRYVASNAIVLHSTLTIHIDTAESCVRLVSRQENDIHILMRVVKSIYVSRELPIFILVKSYVLVAIISLHAYVFLILTAYIS